MPIVASTFKELIFQTLSDNRGEPISIEKFYQAASQGLEFDAHDLTFTKVRGKNTIEPAWKRNLRNCLQGLKSKGEIVNSLAGYWRMPSPNKELFLDADKSWDLIKQTASDSLKLNSTWLSVRNHNSYKVISIEDKKISIERDSVGTIEKLYKQDVVRSINSLNAAGGRLGRRSMIYIVAKEVAIVHFHPNLTWDEGGEFIKVIGKTSNHRVTHKDRVTYNEYGEAPNDNVNELQTFARKVRKGQVRLRKKLLQQYNNKCCISNTGPENVLQAAHITPHFRSGINDSTNGLLLRSDLHDLFDDGLILIHPELLKVFVHPTLKGTFYYNYHNQEIAKRKDNLAPNFARLTEKWDLHDGESFI